MDHDAQPADESTAALREMSGGGILSSNQSKEFSCVPVRASSGLAAML